VIEIFDFDFRSDLL